MRGCGSQSSATLPIANMLGEDEDWLHDLAIDMFPEDGCLHVYGLGEDGVAAFTEYGIECLRQIIKEPSETRRRRSSQRNSLPLRCSPHAYAGARTAPGRPPGGGKTPLPEVFARHACPETAARVFGMSPRYPISEGLALAGISELRRRHKSAKHGLFASLVGRSKPRQNAPRRAPVLVDRSHGEVIEPQPATKTPREAVEAKLASLGGEARFGPNLTPDRVVFRVGAPAINAAVPVPVMFLPLRFGPGVARHGARDFRGDRAQCAVADLGVFVAGAHGNPSQATEKFPVDPAFQVVNEGLLVEGGPLVDQHFIIRPEPAGDLARHLVLHPDPEQHTCDGLRHPDRHRQPGQIGGKLHHLAHGPSLIRASARDAEGDVDDNHGAASDVCRMSSTITLAICSAARRSMPPLSNALAIRPWRSLKSSS